MENKQRDMEKKQKVEGGNRRVLGDIGNIERNQNSRPLTRNFDAKELAIAEASANLVPELEVPANYDRGGALRNQNVDDDQTNKQDPEPEDMAISETGKSSGEDQNPKSTHAPKSKSVSIVSSEPEPDNDDVDADADDANNNLPADEYLDELHNFYKLSEEEFLVSDYMKSQKDINAKMRTIVVDWLVAVHLQFNMKTETLFLTINTLDRYLSLANVTRKELQLVAICSLSLASKYEELTSFPKMDILLEISVNCYSESQFIAMEKDIIEKLQWNLTVPTPYVFLNRLTRAFLAPDKEMENMAFYLAELGLAEYNVMVLFSPSKIAAAIVYSARCILNRIPYWTQYLQNLTGYSKEQIKDCAILLVRMHAGAEDHKVKSIYNKFLGAKKGWIALLPQPNNIQERL